MRSIAPSISSLVVLGLLTPKPISSEIFQLLHDYNTDAFDIKSGYFNDDSLEDFVVIDYRWADSSYKVSAISLASS
jgi:hypothetical protein